ncbi:hypothetical protein [Kitasatospora sp. HPMI-4]|uniref:hypothetical protein n=1 Tax=Kitasatospora sp. HPMI-4 TaxID=3448443 RepID=UPI003F1B7EE9
MHPHFECRLDFSLVHGGTSEVGRRPLGTVTLELHSADGNNHRLPAKLHHTGRAVAA